LPETPGRVHTFAQGDNDMSKNLTQQLPDDPLRLILARLDSIDSRMSGLEARMSGLEDRMNGLEGRMTTLEDKVDRRLQETRPVWEQVLARLDSIENEMRTGFREVKTGLKILNEDILQVRIAQRDLETRTARLESEPAR
jgi:chromosome segregation ATPase